MSNAKELYLGSNKINLNENLIKGKEVLINNENFYKISNVNKMRPFFMSIVSAYDHWLFISSTGALSAGRKNSDNALFPYYTDDKISESYEITGSKTIFHVTKNDQTFLWEPFTRSSELSYDVNRNLFKNLRGNKVIFEEINNDLGLKFSYQWTTCDRFGFVKTSFLKNTSDSDIEIELLDGFQNILPCGLDEAVQNNTSNLADAYKRSELDIETKLGIFALSAKIVDRAEPSESLKANIVFQYGLDDTKTLLSSLQLDKFRRGYKVYEENDIKAEKGAYLINATFKINAGEKHEWLFVADINKSSSDVKDLILFLKNTNNFKEIIQNEIQISSDELYKLVGSADGIQMTADRRRNIRHFANTMFNIMRGGVFDNGYLIEKDDFIAYIKNASISCFNENNEHLANLPDSLDLPTLRNVIDESNSMTFKRLATEYLPIKFSRRHGDPSRPWNKFSINTRDDDTGLKVLDYQGNWRDIFQNWEALAYSYPEFIDGMIYRFLNASTFDGYNPYRLTKDGFDWETIEPDNPWSYIGYWGDHQIIYLLKFLEFIDAYFPMRLNSFFNEEHFVYANVPYIIKDYNSIYKDPKNTIEFDFNLAEKIELFRANEGADGALLRNNKGIIHKVTFIEKILASLFAKLSNFVPDAGIWMNTQRPEWNDANNALVGNGVSMVTLYYIRRFVQFFVKLLDKDSSKSYPISKELYNFYLNLKEIFEDASNSHSDESRKKFTDSLGETASNFRQQIYSSNFSGQKNEIQSDELIGFLKSVLEATDQSIKTNKREDGLYHSYNLINLNDNSISIDRLPEMLEGQVAVLSSGFLNNHDSLNVLDSLKASELFWDDQYSYILYPNKKLPGFLEKNIIPEDRFKTSRLLSELVNDGNKQIVNQDKSGSYHFNSNFNNATTLKESLKNLPEKYKDLLSMDMDLILDIYEDVFNHKAFTGRSGTFYGYEGLGSIYWHMVSKLLLASFEVTKNSLDHEMDSDLIGKLFDHYFEINEGIGANKSPELYGAFPTDPYSHTPRGRGVQQPGMTGQVKEDIISRMGELGLRVNEGLISFNFSMLRPSEFMEAPKPFKYVNLDHEITFIDLEPNSLAFTVCQVPIIYKIAEETSITVTNQDGSEIRYENNILDNKVSTSIFNRTNEIYKIEVNIGK